MVLVWIRLEQAGAAWRVLIKAWADATAYSEAVQNPRLAFRDAELDDGELATNRLGLPLIHSGNFAAVFQMRRPAGPPDWALKCFTRQVHGLRHRYQQIDAHLNGRRLPFMVDFAYQDEGILIGQQPYPLLKMDWVEGWRLDKWLEKRLAQRGAGGALRKLSRLWLRLSEMLREAKIGHGDLQHGNVMLVPMPGSDALALKLIDYDGMYVPGLGGHPPGEIGHPAYQHPGRTSNTSYGPTVDRFSQLVIYTTLQALAVDGRELWDRFYNGDRLLLGPDDFRDPENSEAFRTLWQIDDPDVQALTGYLGLAATEPIERVPSLSELVTDFGVEPLSKEQYAWLNGMFQPLPSEFGEAKSVAFRDIAAADQVIVVEQPSDEDQTSSEGVAGGTRASDSEQEVDVQPTKRWSWPGRLIAGADRSLTRAVGEENTILLTVMRPLALVVGLVLPVVLLWMLWQGGRFLASVLSTPPSDEVAMQEPTTPDIAPAIYHVRVIPEEASLIPSDPGVIVEGEGSERSILVQFPNEQNQVVLRAAHDGYRDERRVLQPVAGGVEELEIELLLIAEPAVYRVHITPEDAKLTPLSLGVTVSGSGTERMVVVSPRGTEEVTLSAVRQGYEEQRVVLHPVSGQREERRIDLKRNVDPAVYRVALSPEAADLRAVDDEGVTITGVGSRRIVTIARPDGKTRIELVATSAGFEEQPIEIQPVPGESRDLVIGLMRSTITNAIGMRFQLIPAGELLLESEDSFQFHPRASNHRSRAALNEQRRVRISRPFYLGVYPVTQRQWMSVMGRLPFRARRSGADDHPVVGVTWDDCRQFIRRLNEAANTREIPAEIDPSWIDSEVSLDIGGAIYRLPTAAEWEYACRAGSSTAYSFGESAESLGDYAWYTRNSSGRRQPVGQKHPNPWRLYDMHGNVWEWCQEQYEPRQGRIELTLRGGSFRSTASDCRSASRRQASPYSSGDDLGFRLVLDSMDRSGAEDRGRLRHEDPFSPPAPEDVELEDLFGPPAPEDVELDDLFGPPPDY